MASAFIIDCNHNMDVDQVVNRTIPLVQYIRAQPGFANVPVVLAEGRYIGLLGWFGGGLAWVGWCGKHSSLLPQLGTPLGGEWIFSDVSLGQVAMNAALFQQYEKLQGMGVQNLYYVKAEELFELSEDSNGDTPTVDGTHPTDLGMAQIAAFYQLFLPTVF